MVQSFVSGLVIVILAVMIGFVSYDWSWLIRISGTVAFVSILGSAVVSGILGSGDRIRANYSREEDWKRRQEISLNLLLFGSPSIATALIYVLF